MINGAVDVSVMLRLGVYILSAHGKVVYVGKSKCPLARIAAHRSLARKNVPAWMPIKGIPFDSVQIIPSHPDRIDALEQELIALYKPRYNTHHKSSGSTSAPIDIQIGNTTYTINSPRPPSTLTIRPL